MASWMRTYADTNRVALDSNALTYLVEALDSSPGPPVGDAAAEKIALARCFIYRQLETVFCITPTVGAELSRIPDQGRLSGHAHWAHRHLQRLTNPSNTADIIFRTHALNAYHPDVDDCRIVAECELLDVDVLLSSDRKLRNAMKRAATPLSILNGQQYWNEMAIASGSMPAIALDPGSTLSTAAWWRI